MKERTVRLLPAILLLLALAGCGGRYVRGLNTQNAEAARLIYMESEGPVRAAARDIELNCEEISGWVGRPDPGDEAAVYSATTSARLRTESKIARETPWWRRAFTTIAKTIGGIPMEAMFEAVSMWFPQVGWVGSLLIAAWSLWKKWKADAKVLAGYEAANRILKSVKNGEALSVDGVKRILADAQSLRNVGPDVLADLQTLWAARMLPKIES